MRAKAWVVISVAIAALLWAVAGSVWAAEEHKKGEKPDLGKIGSEVHKILDIVQQIQSRLDALEKAVRAMGGPAESKAAALPAPPAGQVAVKVTWEYRDFNGKIETYEAPAGAKLWDTRTYRAGGTIPALGASIKDEIVFLEPGKPQLVVLVYRNPLPKEQVFYVIPHVADPSEHTANLDFKCACTGERFKVPANGAWSRVIEYKLAPKVKPGEKIYTHMVAVGEH